MIVVLLLVFITEKVSNYILQ